MPYFLAVKKLAYQTFTPGGLLLDLPMDYPRIKNQKTLELDQQRQYANRIGTRLFNFLGFPTWMMAKDPIALYNQNWVQIYNSNSQFTVENFFRNLIGWQRHTTRKQKVWNAIKLPVVLLWNLGMVPVRFATNLAKVVTILIPGLLALAMSMPVNAAARKIEAAKREKATGKLIGFRMLWVLALGLRFFFDTITFTGRAIFAPVTGFYKAWEYGEQIGGVKGTVLSVLLTTFSVAITLTGYAIAFPLAMKWVLGWTATHTLPSAVSTGMQAVQTAYAWSMAKVATYLPAVMPKLNTLGNVVNIVITGFARLGLTLGSTAMSPLLLGVVAIGGAMSAVIFSVLDVVSDKVSHWWHRPSWYVQLAAPGANPARAPAAAKQEEKKDKAQRPNPAPAKAAPNLVPPPPARVPPVVQARPPLKKPAPQPIAAQLQPLQPLARKDPTHLIVYNDLQLGARLGEGGFGVVYKAKYNGDTVAVKKPHAHGIMASAEFEREAEIMARLRSPYVVSFYGACFEKPNYCLVMEFMEKGSLNTVLQKANPPIPVGGAVYLKYAEYITRGIVYLHREGIIHTDLKSLNILVNNKHEPKITDFGISKFKPAGGPTLAGPTREGARLFGWRQN